MSDGLSPQTKVIAISIGCVLLVIALIVDHFRKKKKPKQELSPEIEKAISQTTDRIMGNLKAQLWAAQIRANPEMAKLQSLDRLYPYTIVESKFEDFQVPDELKKPLGHGICAVIAYELDGAVRLIGTGEMNEFGKSADELWRVAIGNLERLAKERKVDLKTITNGPGGESFMLIADHWAAAACILLPHLFPLAVVTLQNDQLCVSLPNREIMLIFPKRDAAYREEVRKFVREKEEGESERPLTWDLFELRQDGIVPIVD